MKLMPYEVKITDIDTLETYETTIEELKELKEILERYKEKTIELDVVNTEVKRVREMK